MKAPFNKTVLLGLLTATFITGCATGSKELVAANYQSDSKPAAKSLEVPPDLTSPSQQDRYPLPNAAAGLNSKVAANAVITADQKASAKIERAGSQRWVRVEGKSPAEVWPLLKAFWQDNGFVIQNEEPDVGLMETDWAENRAKLGADPLRNLLESVGLGSVMSTPERDRFRIRLEQSGTGTDVFFTHRGMYEIYTKEGREETRWQPRPADPELEATFLARFLVRLGMDQASATENARQSLSQQAKTNAVKLENGKLQLADDFERSWRRVGLALERQGFAIVDRDRTLGVYYVSQIKDESNKPESESSGILSSLAFWKDKPASAGKVPQESMRVQLQSTNNLTSIDVQSSKGQTLSPAEKNSILQKLISELQ